MDREKTRGVLSEVEHERANQDKKWGVQNHEPADAAAEELRRWRAAFAWLESKDGGIYSDQKFKTKPWNAMSCGSCCAGATALEAIEALRAKVEVKT